MIDLTTLGTYHTCSLCRAVGWPRCPDEEAPAAPAAPAKPDCATCGDTHRVVLGMRAEGDGTFDGPCIACPRPCDSCTGRMPNGKPSAYCATSPCACTCHRREAAIVEADRRAAWPEPEGGIAAAWPELDRALEIAKEHAYEVTEQDDEPALDEPTELDLANAARIIAQGRLADLVDGAELLCEAWTQRAETNDDGHDGDRLIASILRACIADLRVLFSGTSAGDDE